jgi:hypothetical protein
MAARMTMISVWRRLRGQRIRLSKLETADIIAAKSTLERSVDCWEGVSHFFAALVVFGLIVEYGGPIVDAIRNHDWQFVAKSIGGVLVTIGVAGELIAGSRSTSKDGQLREANSMLAQKAGERIAELNMKAEQEKHARIKLQKEMAGRRISPEHFDVLRDRLERFGHQKLYVYSSIDQWEIIVFTSHLCAVLSSQCGWDAIEFRSAPPVAKMSIPGVHIFCTPDNESQDAAIALMKALNEIGVKCSAYCPKTRPDVKDWASFDQYWPAGLRAVAGQKCVLALVTDAPLPDYPQ